MGAGVYLRGAGGREADGRAGVGGADGVQSAPQPPDRLPAGRDLRAELAAVHSRLLRELRVRMLEEAADAGIDLIAT